MGTTSAEHRNADAAELINYAFANWTPCPVADSALPPVRVVGGVAESVQPGISGDGYVLLSKSSAQSVERSVSLPDSVTAPVAPGQQLGTLTLSSGGEVISEVPLTATSGVERISTGGVFSNMLRILFCLPTSST